MYVREAERMQERENHGICEHVCVCVCVGNK